MTLVAISLSERGFVRYYDPNGVDLGVGDICIVEDKETVEAPGKVCMMESRSSCQLQGRTYPRVLRKAEETDIEQWTRNEQRQMEAMTLCKEKARQLNLEMKISTVRFDDRQRRVIFYFTADQRVDFRQLVKELASSLRARIELWQIGVRDETRLLQGFGICGKELCCGSWIRDFQPVSIRQAKDQDLLLSPAKLSGLCGRLRCCLTYEHEQYKGAMTEAPVVGAICRCQRIGSVVVVDRNLLLRRATVRDEAGALRQIDFSEVDEVIGKAPPSALKQDAAARLSAAIAAASAVQPEDEPPAAGLPAFGRELEDVPATKPQSPAAPPPSAPEPAAQSREPGAREPGARRGGRRRRRRGQPSGAPAEASPSAPQRRAEAPPQSRPPAEGSRAPAPPDTSDGAKSKSRSGRGRRRRRKPKDGEKPAD